MRLLIEVGRIPPRERDNERVKWVSEHEVTWDPDTEPFWVRIDPATARFLEKHVLVRVRKLDHE